tara:strand:- start:468 stop:1055 length:588 start_codon:yes stop_codon:yes gene_type:complete
MPAPRVDLKGIQRGVERYNAGDRPWRQTLNQVDWFIIFEGELYPLKYTYALAVDVPPITYTTDQMKSAMRGLGLTFHSLKSETEELDAFYKRVNLARKNEKARRKRLEHARKIPTKRYITRLEFVRNADVVAEVLERADGYCERCQNRSPFCRATDGTPYLEVHHKIMLARGGEDTADNAEALCPNCHREKHYGK